jgi:hypothetical protein
MRDLWWTKCHKDRLFSEFFHFLCQYHCTVALHIHMSSGGWTIDPLVAAVQRRSLNPSTWARLSWTRQEIGVLHDHLSPPTSEVYTMNVSSVSPTRPRLKGVMLLRYEGWVFLLFWPPPSCVGFPLRSRAKIYLGADKQRQNHSPRGRLRLWS